MNQTEIFAAAFLIILALAASYLRFGHTEIKKRIKFELLAVLGLVTGVLFIVWYVQGGMKGTGDSALWETVAGVQCFAFSFFYILVAWLLRWLIYSKRWKKGP